MNDIIYAQRIKILVIAEHNNQCLNSSTRNTFAAAIQLSHCLSQSKKIELSTIVIDILIAGFDCESVVKEATQINGVNTVLYADQTAYQHHLPENMAECVVSLAASYEFILAPATTFGKNFLPRVAALLDVEQISDVCQIALQSEKMVFVRPIYAGNALETLVCHESIQVMTIRPSAFHVPHQEPRQGVAAIEQLDERKDSLLSQYVDTEVTHSERPELGQAKIIVSGGRGFQSAEKFKVIEALADKLNAAIGASRAAVDAGFAPNDYQVGQTGKIVAPDLYMAIGISGAIQHMAGMKDSRVIVAINKDAEAPIFKIATYGLVGDLFEIIPALLAELDSVR